VFCTAFGESGLGLPFAYAGDLGTRARETNIGSSISNFINNQLRDNSGEERLYNYISSGFNSVRNLFFNTDTMGGNIE